MNQKQSLEDILKKEKNQFSIPLQNVVVSKLDIMANDLPKVKLIDIENFQTKSYKVTEFYKPISKIIVGNE